MSGANKVQPLEGLPVLEKILSGLSTLKSVEINKNKATMLERFGITDTSQYKYVIGLDFGDGETSAAIVELSLSKIGINDVKNLIMDSSNRQNIYTAMHFDRNGKITIGNAAKLKDPGNGSLFLNFKIEHSL